MRSSIVKRLAAGLALLAAVGLLGACTTREVLSGAAGGAAGYVVGKETAADDD